MPWPPLLLRHGLEPGDEMHPPPDAVIGAGNLRLVVADEPELVGRCEDVGFFIRAPGRDVVTTDEALDAALIEAPLLGDLIGDHNPLPFHLSLAVVEVVIRCLGHECLDRDGGHKVTRQHLECRSEGAFTIGPLPIEEEEDVLIDVAGE